MTEQETTLTPAQRVLAAASAFLVTLGTEGNMLLTNGGMAVQQMLLDEHLQALTSHPELAVNPGFRRYIQNVSTTLAQLANAFEKQADPTYQAFLAVYHHLAALDAPDDVRAGNVEDF